MTTTAVITLNVVPNRCQNVLVLLVARRVFLQLLVGGGCLFFLEDVLRLSLPGAQPQLSSRSCLVFDPCFDHPGCSARCHGASDNGRLSPTQMVELARLVQSSLLEPGQENLAGRIQTLTGQMSS